jgi:hypothetical protein
MLLRAMLVMAHQRGRCWLLPWCGDDGTRCSDGAGLTVEPRWVTQHSAHKNFLLQYSLK